MAGAQISSFMALAKAFDFIPYTSLSDVGGLKGRLMTPTFKLYNVRFMN